MPSHGQSATFIAERGDLHTLGFCAPLSRAPRPPIHSTLVGVGSVCLSAPGLNFEPFLVTCSDLKYGGSKPELVWLVV